jgi:hypothetical protein
MSDRRCVTIAADAGGLAVAPLSRTGRICLRQTSSVTDVPLCHQARDVLDGDAAVGQQGHETVPQLAWCPVRCR